MVHCRHLATVPEGHAQDLHSRRSRAITAHIVSPRTDHLDRFANCLRCKRGWHSVVTIKPATESSPNQISAQHDFVLAAAKRLGHKRHSHRLPLISSMDFENAILFKS